MYSIGKMRYNRGIIRKRSYVSEYSKIGRHPSGLLAEKILNELFLQENDMIDITTRNASYKEPITEDLLDETIDLICSFVE